MPLLIKPGIIKGVFLLLIAISTNFMVETIGYNLRTMLRTNLILKHILLFLIIYFSINFADYSISPFETLKGSFVIWLLYLIFVKMPVFLSISIFILLGITYYCNSYVAYYEKLDNKKYTTQVSVLNSAIYYLNRIILAIFVIGFFMYLRMTPKNTPLSTIVFGKL
jgi:hypothetical protein